MFSITSASRLPRRHRLGRLRLRLDGTEAQGVLRPQFHQLLRAAGREQVCPRGGRVRQSVFEEPRRESLSRAGRAARLAAAAAGSEGPRRPRAEARGPDQVDGQRDEARQSGAREGGGGDGRSRLEAGARLVAGREQVDRRNGPRRAAVSERPRVPRRLLRAGRHGRLLANAQRRARSRVEEHGIASYVQAICGQEIGSKKETLAAVQGQVRSPRTS